MLSLNVLLFSIVDNLSYLTFYRFSGQNLKPFRKFWMSKLQFRGTSFDPIYIKFSLIFDIFDLYSFSTPHHISYPSFYRFFGQNLQPFQRIWMLKLQFRCTLFDPFYINFSLISDFFVSFIICIVS